jgi:chromosome partitioning protein
MKTITVANFKGGVAKTISAANIAHILTAQHGKRILLVDNDPQGNLSRLFNLYDYDNYSIADVFAIPAIEPDDLIAATAYERLDLIPANLALIGTHDAHVETSGMLGDYLEALSDSYDYCVIDNAPTAGIYLLRALAASDEVLIPVSIDQFSIDGLTELLEQINGAAAALQRDISVAGAFITNFQSTKAQRSGAEWLRANAGIRVFETVIRRSAKVTESTIYKLPLSVHSPRSNPAKDYAALVDEYLGGGNG